MALTGRSRKKVELLLPRKVIFSSAMVKCGSVHLMVWPHMDMGVLYGIFDFRRDQSSHFCVVSSMIWHIHTHTHTHTQTDRHTHLDRLCRVLKSDHQHIPTLIRYIPLGFPMGLLSMYQV